MTVPKLTAGMSEFDAAVEMVPSDPVVAARLVKFITLDILALFERRLTADDRAMYRPGEEKSWSDPSRVTKIQGTLDQVIIEKAQILGWRVYLSPLVLNRMAKWSHSGDRGIQRLQQLGQAVTFAARVEHGEAKLPITAAEWREHKKRGVDELRRLFKQFHANFNHRRRAPSYQDACDWIATTIRGSPGAFPLLRVNLTSLSRFFEVAEDPTFRRRLVLCEIRPAALFDEWVALSRNLSPETFRQSVSNLPASKL